MYQVPGTDTGSSVAAGGVIAATAGAAGTMSNQGLTGKTLTVRSPLRTVVKIGLETQHIQQQYD